MKKKNKYRFTSALLAVMVFISSTGFSVDTHYCKGELKTVNFISEAKSCHSNPHKLNKACHHSKSAQALISKKDCCENKLIHVYSEISKSNDYSEVKVSNQLGQLMVSPACFTALHLATRVPAFARYKPPLISKDIQIFFQTFLL